MRTATARGGGDEVVLIVNAASPDSNTLARHYLAARRIPRRNVVEILCPDHEVIADDECADRILRPVRDRLARSGMDATVDYLVTTRGVPLRTVSGLSVDGLLMTLDLSIWPGAANPYFRQRRAFSRRDFYIYLCTRLDGFTTADAKALVDRSLAARPRRGVFLLDLDPRRSGGSYNLTNLEMRAAAEHLRGAGWRVHLDEGPGFAQRTDALMGYFSWGSNDAAFDPFTYRRLRFAPGAIAETAVSTSARTLRPTRGGQSLIAHLVGQGVTGVKGYVTEPYLRAVAHPDVLFPRYVAGRNLAEAFYAASAQIRWKDVVLGDPLCAPYRNERPLPVRRPAGAVSRWRE